MRKILALILSCALLILLLAGCSDTADHGDWGYIEENGKMIIGITYYAPMNYFDENNNLTGFETEFAIAVCEILGVEPEFIEIEWGSKETELAAKTIDTIWNGMTITPERAEEMDITPAYMDNVPVIVVRAADEEKYRNASADDMAGVAVVAEIESTLEYLIKSNEFFAQADYTSVERKVAGLIEVKSGTADMTVIDYVMALDVLREGGDYSDLVFIEKGFPRDQFGVAFRKKSPETLKKFNEAVSELRLNGTLQALADKYGLQELFIK